MSISSEKRFVFLITALAAIKFREEGNPHLINGCCKHCVIINVEAELNSKVVMPPFLTSLACLNSNYAF